MSIEASRLFPKSTTPILRLDNALVATIELVSPSNKEHPLARQLFVAKCAALLRQNVSVTIVDVVTSHEHNLYADLLRFFGLTDRTLSQPPASIYAVTCRRVLPRKRFYLEAWHRPLAIGQPLPALPVWLRDDLAITLNLESCYEETCSALSIE